MWRLRRVASFAAAAAATTAAASTATATINLPLQGGGVAECRGRGGGLWQKLGFGGGDEDVAKREELIRRKSSYKGGLGALAGTQLTLYQYEVCPYCCKVKAFLDYHHIPYSCVEVSPMGKKELSFSEYKKVPVMMIGNEQLNDSTTIIAELTARLPKPRRNLRKEDDERIKTWSTWVDERFVKLLPPNIYRNVTESLESFDYITNHGNFSPVERIYTRYAGACVMYFVSKRLKKKYDIGDEREALYAAAEEFLQGLNGRDFMSGSQVPSVADLTLFGAIRSIEGLQSFTDLMANTGIQPWYSRMTAAVGPSSRVEEDS